jgi:hypothetical protein
MSSALWLDSKRNFPGGKMHAQTIISELKIYQFSEKNSETLQRLRNLFLSAIHPRIKNDQEVDAEMAVGRVLKQMFEIPVRGEQCCAAMLQLCREVAEDYDVFEDRSLVNRINQGKYFVSPPLESKSKEFEVPFGLYADASSRPAQS